MLVILVFRDADVNLRLLEWIPKLIADLLLPHLLFGWFLISLELSNPSFKQEISRRVPYSFDVWRGLFSCRVDIFVVVFLFFLFRWLYAGIALLAFQELPRFHLACLLPAFFDGPWSFYWRLSLQLESLHSSLGFFLELTQKSLGRGNRLGASRRYDSRAEDHSWAYHFRWWWLKLLIVKYFGCNPWLCLAEHIGLLNHNFFLFDSVARRRINPFRGIQKLGLI